MRVYTPIGGGTWREPDCSLVLWLIPLSTIHSDTYIDNNSLYRVLWRHFLYNSPWSLSLRHPQVTCNSKFTSDLRIKLVFFFKLHWGMVYMPQHRVNSLLPPGWLWESNSRSSSLTARTLMHWAMSLSLNCCFLTKCSSLPSSPLPFFFFT